MSLQIVFGRSGTGKTSYIFNEIGNSINNGYKKYIITPEQFSFTAEKELLNNIKKISNSAAVINAEILTFNRMSHRVSSEIGGIAKPKLSNSGKAMLIYSILANKKNDLKFLGKSSNNVELILTQITELKKHGVNLTILKTVMDLVKDSNQYLYSKLNDIYIVYEKYEEKIADKYIDENDSLTVLANQLDYTHMFDDSEIYIDEFVGFTKQEYEIIKKLMKVARKVIITVCSDSVTDLTNEDIDIFYSNKETVNKLLKIAKEAEVQVKDPIYLKNLQRFKSPELIHLEQNLFAIPYKIYEQDVNNIRLFLANNQYSEIEQIAKEIIHLVRDENYKYKDISIITQNIELYSNLCKAIFNKYKIPVYIDQKEDINQNILVKFIIAILDVFAKNWTYDSVFNYIKTGLTNVTVEEVLLLEKYATKWEINGNKWYKADWQFHDEREFGEEKIKQINGIRVKVVTPLLDLKNKLVGTKTAKQISTNIYNFLIDNQINKKVEEKINQLNDIGELNIASEYETSWKIIMQVLDEMVMVFGDENISFDNYMQVLKTGFCNSDLGTIPMAQDQVVIGDVDRSRNHKVRTVFIIGLNDGTFPSINKAEGFLDDEDRERVKQFGMELAKGTLERIYEEKFNIYKAFTTPEEKLYLSYASANIDGKSLRPSTLISRLKKMFKNLKEESDIVNRKSEIILPNPTFEELLFNLREFLDGKKIDPIWFNVFAVYNNDEKWKSKLDKALKTLSDKNKPEKISKDNIDKMYGDTFKTSISKLEQYRRCPFSYYLKYGLKLNDKDTCKIESVDTGSFMHDVVDTFFSITEDKNINLKDLEDKEIENIVSQIVNDKMKLDRNYIFTTSAKYVNLVNRLRKVVIKSIKYIVETLKQSEFNVYGHEVEFGKGGEYKPIKISTFSGKTVEIEGKIDRIDVAKNPDGTYVRIIDYKSSIKDIDLNQVVAGLQIQLLTYLEETCKVEDFIPAGVLYFNLSDSNIKADKNMSDEEIEEEIRKQFKMNGLILADVNVIKMMDKNIEETCSSQLIPARLKKDGEIDTSKTRGISLKQFEYLQKYINKIIKQISDEIVSGNIDIKPFYKSNAQRGNTPCEYCSYKTICKFDTNNEGNSYNYIKNLNKDAILEMISKQDENVTTKEGIKDE